MELLLQNGVKKSREGLFDEVLFRSLNPYGKCL